MKGRNTMERAVWPFVLAGGAMALAPAAEAQSRDPAQLLLRADANGDGRITREEFTAGKARLFDRLIVAVADKGWQRACRDDASLAPGLNTYAGRVTNRPVAEATGFEAQDLADALAP